MTERRVSWECWAVAGGVSAVLACSSAYKSDAVTGAGRASVPNGSGIAPSTLKPPTEPAPLELPAPAVTLAFQRPAEAEVLSAPAGAEDSLQVAVALRASGLSTLELQLDAKRAALLRAAPWAADLEVHGNGKHELQAIGRDEAGQEVIRLVRGIEVNGLGGAGCLDQLAAQGVSFRPGHETRGIVDPILLDPVIEGVAYRYSGSEKLSPLLASCQLGLRLERLAMLAKSHGFDEVRHLGVYNYRPINNPTCSARHDCKLSQHALANAIDIHDLRVAGKSVRYSTETDWVIDKTVPVCPGKPHSDADRALHEFACQMHSEKVFNVILTPNYNGLHRNHLHVDLTPASFSIRGEGVDPSDPELQDD